ncbi:uncharacterized protein LOC134769730 [Penaeus indicus]|uniref:uncharacterized protein LOC134769730 n=1 Tax=Penaeus indicus TaxID=29960 RepID=UPI00300D85B3
MASPTRKATGAAATPQRRHDTATGVREVNCSETPQRYPRKITATTGGLAVKLGGQVADPHWVDCRCVACTKAPHRPLVRSPQGPGQREASLARSSEAPCGCERRGQLPQAVPIPSLPTPPVPTPPVPTPPVPIPPVPTPPVPTPPVPTPPVPTPPVPIPPVPTPPVPTPPVPTPPVPIPPVPTPPVPTPPVPTPPVPTPPVPTPPVPIPPVPTPPVPTPPVPTPPVPTPPVPIPPVPTPPVPTPPVPIPPVPTPPVPTPLVPNPSSQRKPNSLLEREACTYGRRHNVRHSLKLFSDPFNFFIWAPIVTSLAI